MKFSYSEVWNDTAQMLKSHGSLIAAVAGVFLLLPTLLVGYFFPQPAPSETNPLGSMLDYMVATWPWLLLNNLANMLGAITIYRLLLTTREQTVGSAIAAALPILPFYFIMYLVTWLAIGFGASLFLLPGIYLLGRLFLSSPVQVAERAHDPIGAIRGSWALTRGYGWAIAGLVVVVFAVGMLVNFVISAILGTLVIIAVGREGVGSLVILIVTSTLTAALYAVMTVLIAAIYRALRAEPSGSVAPVSGI